MSLTSKKHEPKLRLEVNCITKSEYCMACGGPEGPPRILFHVTVGTFLTIRACRSCMDLLFHKYSEAR